VDFASVLNGGPSSTLPKKPELIKDHLAGIFISKENLLWPYLISFSL
jgi:hypothetical protein